MRYDLTDAEWSVIKALLPMNRQGAKPRNNRRVLNGIFWVLRTGGHGLICHGATAPNTTAYNRFNRWHKDGIWDRLTDAVVAVHDGDVQMIDSSVVRVHQHASGVKKRVAIVVSGAAGAA